MKKTLLAILLCMTLLLSGCSSKESIYSNQESFHSKSSEDYGSADYRNDGNLSYEENQDSVDNAAITESEVNQNSSAPETTANTTPDPSNTQKEQKLVYTCDMSIESLEYDKTVDAIKQEIKQYHGIIQEENESDNNSYWYDASRSVASKHLYLVIRIPAESYEAFLNGIQGNGQITSKNMRVDNITKQYSEIETTIQSLQKQEKRLLDMMDQAKSIEEMITVEKRLTEVQNELAQYKNSLSGLDLDVNYSTINLSIDEVVKYDAPSSTFVERFLNTLEESKSNFLSFLENGLFTIILMGPILLVLLIILLLILKGIRLIRGRKGSRKKKEKKSLLSRKKDNTKEKSEESSLPEESDDEMSK